MITAALLALWLVLAASAASAWFPIPDRVWSVWYSESPDFKPNAYAADLVLSISANGRLTVGAGVTMERAAFTAWEVISMNDRRCPGITEQAAYRLIRDRGLTGDVP